MVSFFVLNSGISRDGLLKIRRVREEHTFILVVNKDIILLSDYFLSNKSKQPSGAAGL